MRTALSTAFGFACWLLSGLAAPAQSGAVLLPSTARPAVPAPHAPPPEKSLRSAGATSATLAAGFPLRVQLDHRYRMRLGARVQGRLLDPVYAGDHIVLPVNTPISGSISQLRKIDRNTRTWALLDGDVTPLRTPVLTFDSLQLPGGKQMTLRADATERTAGVVKMSSQKTKQSLLGKVKSMIAAKIDSIRKAMHSPHKSDTALQVVYSQLPYHPQDIWAGTQFDAELAQPITVPDPKAADVLPVTPPQGHIPPGTIDARLVTGISSATGKSGDAVEAVLTRPYLDANASHVILPTGTRLLGVVTQARPARKFGRNGTLRFTFRQVELPQGTMQQIHGEMTAVEGQKGQNVSVDSEGGAHANSGQGKFLAPLALGLLAGNSLDADQNAVHAGVSSNGFGLLGQVGSMIVVIPSVTAGFAYYAVGKAITRRWILRGHDVVFPRDTRLQLAVADR